MSSFTLQAVLGSGSSRLSCHHRQPLAAYQAGSILVIWDYTRLGEEARKFILLQPGQCCSQIFFTKDAQHLLGFGSLGRAQLTVWRCDGAKVVEHTLADERCLAVDVHRETQHMIVLLGASVVSISVLRLDQSFCPRQVATGSLGRLKILAVKLVDDGRHFAVAEANAVHFWSYAGRTPHQVLRVELPKALRGFQVEGRLAYLLPEQGKLQVMNFQGERVQVAPTALPPTCLDVQGGTVCAGCADGSLLVSRNSCPDHWKSWPAPSQLCDGMPPGISCITLAANEDYACVCFEDATHGVIHLGSGQYVALRAGHVGGIRSICMAPMLRAPVGLATRVLDIERVLRSKSLAFVSVGCGQGCIAWPKQGPPVRGFLERVPEVPGGHVSVPVSNFGLGRAALTTAVFHPSACLGADGSLTGAYALIAGAEDGSIHILQAEAEERVSFRTQHVRPRGFQPEVTQLPGAKLASCCSLDVSRCGCYVLASFSDGAVDMLDFPSLSRLTQIQYSQPLPSDAKQKAVFVWRATASQRAYDTNIYAVSREKPWEAVLHEVYPLGDTLVKAVKRQFVLDNVCQAAGGFFTDFCVHPSQLYLVASAALPSSNARSILLVYELWSDKGDRCAELLNSVEVFTSLLVAPNAPLQPSICMDCSGSYIFCASTPSALGPVDLQFQGDPGHGVSGCSDLLTGQLPELPAQPQDCASVVCAVDFATGEPCYQASINASCIGLGSPWHDPSQLLVGARDGTISVWQPPDSISERIRSVLQDSLEAYSKVEDEGAMSLSRVEQAVSFHWATKCASSIDWYKWGQPVPRAPGEPLLPLPAVRKPAPPAPSSDVVIQARQQWAQTQEPQVPAAQFLGLGPGLDLGLGLGPGPGQGLGLQGLGVVGLHGEMPEPEIDPVSGLEVYELPAPYAHLLSRPRERLRDAELVLAPELQEEFGSSAEHFQDPLPTSQPRSLDLLKPGKPGKPGRERDVGHSVISDLDRFERCFPDAQAPETPRSGEVAVG